MVHTCKNQGKRVGVIKHHGHTPFLDTSQLSKDTGLHLQAGADWVVGVSMTQTEVFTQHTISLSTLIEQAKQCNLDILLIEGYKQEPYPKVVLLRNLEDLELLEICSEIQLVGNIVQSEEENFFIPSTVPVFFDIDSGINLVLEYLERREQIGSDYLIPH